MTDSMALKTTLNTDFIPSSAQPRMVYALLELETKHLRPQSLPASLALVVDASLSMQIPLVTEEQFEKLASMGAVREIVRDGIPVWKFDYVPPGFAEECPRPIDFVKLALLAALEELRPDDHCGIIAFAGSARLLSPITPESRKNLLLKSIEELERVNLGDDTQLASGLALAVRELKRADSNATRRILMLTDGFAQDIDETMHWTQQAVKAGISVSTMGLGVEFNESLLINLADISNGNAYLIEDASDIPSAFRSELNAAQGIAMKDMRLALRFYGGVELRKAFRIKPTISDLGSPPAPDGMAHLSLGDLDPQSPPALLLELIIPPRQPGRYRLAQAVLSGTNLAGASGPNAQADLLLEVGVDQRHSPNLNPRVMNLVETVSAFKLQTRALDDAALGNITGATQKLRAAATRLLGLGEAELAEAVLTEAENLEQQGQASAARTKKLRYETRRLTQSLK